MRVDFWDPPPAPSSSTFFGVVSLETPGPDLFGPGDDRFEYHLEGDAFGVAEPNRDFSGVGGNLFRVSVP